MLTKIYLSGDRPDIVVGNYIGEMKTIKDQSLYSNEIREGIRIHQQIDQFISGHAAVAASRKRLSPKFSKYATGIVSFFYDHFLASDWQEYHHLPLEKFAFNTYKTLLEYQAVLPYKAKVMLPRMIRGNWLHRFATLGGVNEAIRQMDIKSTRLTYLVSAFENLIGGYKEFKQDFYDFFPALRDYSNRMLEGKPETGNGPAAAGRKSSSFIHSR